MDALELNFGPRGLIEPLTFDLVLSMQVPFATLSDFYVEPLAAQNGRSNLSKICQLHEPTDTLTIIPIPRLTFIAANCIACSLLNGAWCALTR